MEYFWIRYALKYGQREYLYRSLLAQKSNQEATMRMVAYYGNACKV
jgi:hypothetical protein